jgi:predicted patatin/cPLA2 family phospholipase
MKTKYNKRKRIATKNTRILEAVMATLESLTNTVHLKEMVMNDIQVHLLDEDGDGVILSLAYDENGELEKTFSSVDEFYEDTIEVELEDDDAETALFDEEYYGGREDFTVTVLDEETEDEFLKYDLHKIDKPLLN